MRKEQRDLTREPPEALNPTEWVHPARLEMQRKAIGSLLFAYWFLLVSTMLVLFLQGFRAWGFNLDHGLLMWLGGATIGEIGGLLLLILRGIFRRQR